jgi:hypothetical protein
VWKDFVQGFEAGLFEASGLNWKAKLAVLSRVVDFDAVPNRS